MGAVEKAREAVTASGARKGGLPLALVIARYFVYVLAVVGLLAVMLLLVFSLLVSSGAVYMASYADENVGGMVEMLESGEAEPEGIPACYRWTVFDRAGKVVASDMSERDQVAAQEALRQGSSVVGADGLFGGTRRQATAALPNGDVCVLQYDFLPVFTSRELRDVVPDPQALLIGAFFVLFAVAMALIAMRASRVIARKMRPLVEAASYIERQDLDFAVGSTNVREVNEVLAAMERMRAALNESLHARWAADEARRRQVSALAHDLKTPLSIARWNTDLLREAPLDEEQEACAESLSDSIERMDDYVRLLVETSRTEAAPALTAQIDLPLLAQKVKSQAEPLCAAHKVKLDFPIPLAATLVGDEAQLVRAVVNLVSNAAEYAPVNSVVAVRCAVRGGVVRIAVEDEGPGFSTGALQRGKERFYRERDDRNSTGGHYGLGLSIVDDIVSAHGGMLVLSNRESGGARCVVELPISAE